MNVWKYVRLAILLVEEKSIKHTIVYNNNEQLQVY